MKRTLCMILVVLTVFSLAACSNNENKDNVGETQPPIVEPEKKDEIEISDALKFKASYEILNDKEGTVQISISEDNPVVILEEEEVLPFLENETGIIYFGFPSCPWCRNAIPALLEVATENNMPVYYFDVLQLRKTENETYEKLKQRLDEYLLTDDEGVKKLFVPDVYFLKDGKIVSRHIDTVPTQKDAKIPLTEEQFAELKSIYQEGIDAILGETNE